jgi:hypothetical protein
MIVCGFLQCCVRVFATPCEALALFAWCRIGDN